MYMYIYIYLNIYIYIYIYIYICIRICERLFAIKEKFLAELRYLENSRDQKI